MKVMGPTLPRNITTEIRIFPNVLNCEVTSRERPTVPKAEVTSKRAGKSSSPSETMSARVLRRTSSEAAARTESALATSGRGSVRQKRVILPPDLGDDDEGDEGQGRYLYAPARRGRGGADEHEHDLYEERGLPHLGVAHRLESCRPRRYALKERHGGFRAERFAT